MMALAMTVGAPAATKMTFLANMMVTFAILFPVLLIREHFRNSGRKK